MFRQLPAESCKWPFCPASEGSGGVLSRSYVRHYAEVQHDMVGAHVFLGGAGDLNEMIRRVFDKLLKESVQKKWYEPVKELFGKNVDKVGLFGLNVQLQPSPLEIGGPLRRGGARFFAHDTRRIAPAP